MPLKGEQARHCIAFARRHEGQGILVLATRLYRQLGSPGPDAIVADGAAIAEHRLPHAHVWGDTEVDLAGAGIAGLGARGLVDLLACPAEPAVGPVADRAPAGPAVSRLGVNLLALLSWLVLRLR